MFVSRRNERNSGRSPGPGLPHVEVLRLAAGQRAVETRELLQVDLHAQSGPVGQLQLEVADGHALDRKSTRLNSSHLVISYAVFCLKKKKKYIEYHPQSRA